MARYFEALRYNLGSLTRFNGRDPRRVFWPYAGTVIAVGAVVGWIASLILIVNTMPKYQEILRNHAGLQPAGSDKPDPIVDPFPEMLDVMNTMMADLVPLGTGLLVISVLLLGAAVARRLHDKGIPGWVGAIPLSFLAFELTMTPVAMSQFRTQFQTGEPSVSFDSSLWLTLTLANLCYTISLVVIIVLLALRSEPMDNRYGPAPPM